MEALVTGFIPRVPCVLCNRPRFSLTSLAAPSFKPLKIICMAEPYLITKLDSAERTWKELSVRLADPDVVSNPTEYQNLAQSVSELDLLYKRRMSTTQIWHRW